MLKDIIWMPPLNNLIKCNTNEVFLGVSRPVIYGGTFRDFEVRFFSFSININIFFSLQEEIIGVTKAIELARQKEWNNLWLETDSTILYSAFKNSALTYWQLRNIWLNR